MTLDTNINTPQSNVKKGENPEISLTRGYYSDRISQLTNSKNSGFSIDEKLLEKYPFLANYLENLEYYFGKTGFSEGDILGEGDYGLVIRLPNGRVMKIAKTKEVSDKLQEEAENQEKFFIVLEELRIEYGDKVIPDWFKIPFAMESLKQNNGGYFSFEMEYIEGVTLKNIDTKIYFENDFKGIDEKELSIMSDNQLDDYLISRGHTKDQIAFLGYNGLGTFESIFPEKGKILGKIIDILRDKGYEHTDLHTKNIMLSGENVYMIDFGMVKLPL